MLNQDTKRKIDSARNILVGKVPDPKAQVEQITTALIYKFMDDMDKEAQELGGKARYFTNGYEKYSWTKLMDVKLGGHERLNLYFEAVSSLGRNQHMPQIFRDIFGDKSLPPYRDPQTLTLFLKEINGFNFDHSEDLGDAYEYLLNVIGTSGEAGQFRTPRQIIDFIATAVDPKKGDTVCDPACGTAGFLISAYKHILKQHDGLDDPEKTEKPLTPDEKKNLMNHFVGYDIDPGMVRIATVNMYLHNFPEPKIFEYDTLTYEDRWDETFDVILANPPFMTPKGGIRPHKRFSIQANRSEVLFVDYIADHLNLNGKAGVIVPEGIIFNNQVAYKNLRKKLVESCLIAVVSLPQGIFIKPGGKGNVKTGVLIFDKELVKKTKDVLFVKISNDGFDLGAQRRVIDKNDLPLALGIIKRYKSALKNGKDFELDEEENKIAHIVAKEKIAETGDYNLTNERYKETAERINQKYPMVELGEVCEMYQPKTITSKEIKSEGKYKVFGANGVIGYYDKYNHEDSEVLITCRGATCGTLNLSEPNSWITGNAMVIKPKDDRLSKQFLFYILKQSNFKSVISGSAQPQITRTSLSPLEIPLPPIEIQKEIVEQIEVKQNAIDHAKAIIQNLERERRYFGQSLRKLEGVEWVELGEIFEKVSDQINPQNNSGSVVYIGLENIESNSGNIVGEINTEMKSIRSIKNVFKESDILYGKLRPNLNKVWLSDRKGICSTDILVLRKKKEEMNPWLYTIILRSEEFNTEVLKGLKGAQLPRVSFEYLSKIKIPYLVEELQERYLSDLKNEEEAINANKKMIEIYEQKISDVLSEI
ncbi:MAG: N-6 DNA methylase [Patescibacteria group bacterium]|nr:N-6 DNA methylase [Patescibacteria group bacterium]